MTFHMSHAIRKPVFAICEQQRRRSACASVQSDQRLCCSLSRYYNFSSFCIQNFKRLPSFCGCAGLFESTLVANPEDRFSRDVAHIKNIMNMFQFCLTIFETILHFNSFSTWKFEALPLLFWRRNKQRHSL